MTTTLTTSIFQPLVSRLEGELLTDKAIRTLYATDASAYREMPQAVAFPKTVRDLQYLVAFARQHKIGLIPRTAGTSLAGQVVGNGIVMDMSRYFNQILEINADEKWVRVQPGVVRDELNRALKPFGLMYAPETSTANRAMIGGMIGNNSCGANSVIYGSAREHLLEAELVYADGEVNTVKAEDPQTFRWKAQGAGAKGEIEKKGYALLQSILGSEANRKTIEENSPKENIPRRNTGYALDLLAGTQPFDESGEAFNLCKLIAGSEGTLAIVTEAKLNLVPLPPKEVGLLCVHFNTIDESLRANLLALEQAPRAVELIDHYILECTKGNIEQSKNRFFVQGDPGAILVIEFACETREEVEKLAGITEQKMKAAGLGYHFPLLFGEDTSKIWTLRKAGLGLLSNMPGDNKPVPVIEDTAVDVQQLPEYIRDFTEILKKYDLYAVHYAHAGSGELHLRPILNMKTSEGQRMFRVIAEEIADLVKKYQGSLSGEHGDGRLRGEFIPRMVGPQVYEWFRQIKYTFDPDNIFNPGKIVDTAPMDKFLRYEPDQKVTVPQTNFDFGPQNVLQHAEQCNGSGDCRKSQQAGGTMCPSYMATKNEKDTTRARANILREFLTRSNQQNPFNHKEIYEVMDLCLSCKGCKSECPSNVDVGKLKAEFLQNYYDANGVPFRTWLIGHFDSMNRLASLAPWAYNFAFNAPVISGLLKKATGFAAGRSMPKLSSTTLKSWMKSRKQVKTGKRQVYLFADEFTNYHDVTIGQKAVELLEHLGYEVLLPKHVESGRAFMSKGLLKEAAKLARQNVEWLHPIVSAEIPLVGIEPSAILSFRDEYPDLLRGEWQQKAKELAPHTLMFDEFLAKEFEAGHISKEQFKGETKTIRLHGHCHQKALGSLVPTKKMLQIPQGYQVQLIPSGCCGMAGSFGYEEEHFELSMQVGELVLFPTVRSLPEDVLVAAPGTSCRHQIKDGTGKVALHPVEILWEALKR